MADPTSPDGAGGGTVPLIARIEHNKDAQAKKVQLVGFTPAGSGPLGVTVETNSTYVGAHIAPVPGSQFEIIPFGSGSNALYGELKVFSITGTSLTTSFAALSPSITSISGLAEVVAFNSCDTQIQVSLNGTTTHFTLDPHESFTLSIASILYWTLAESSTPYTVKLYAKATSSIPTSGSLRITTLANFYV